MAVSTNSTTVQVVTGGEHEWRMVKKHNLALLIEFCKVKHFDPALLFLSRRSIEVIFSPCDLIRDFDYKLAWNFQVGQFPLFGFGLRQESCQQICPHGTIDTCSPDPFELYLSA